MEGFFLIIIGVYVFKLNITGLQVFSAHLRSPQVDSEEANFSQRNPLYALEPFFFGPRYSFFKNIRMPRFLIRYSLVACGWFLQFLVIILWIFSDFSITLQRFFFLNVLWCRELPQIIM